MEKEEIVRWLKLFGLAEGKAQYYAELEQRESWAYLPIFRLLRPLNFSLENCEKMAAKQMQEKEALQSMPLVAALLQAGATPEQIAAFKYDVMRTAYEQVLTLLDDAGAADDATFPSIDKECLGCPQWRLMERAADGKMTGRYLAEAHGYLPFKNWNQ